MGKPFFDGHFRLKKSNMHICLSKILKHPFDFCMSCITCMGLLKSFDNNSFDGIYPCQNQQVNHNLDLTSTAHVLLF